MTNIWLHRFSVLLAICTLLLVAAGASVTSKEAGLSVPDWPLSYGKVMPPMQGGVLFEHGHRMIATTVGFLTVVFAIWVWRVDKRAWMRWLSLIAVAAVILQGVLGGLTVLFLLPKFVSIGHACLAQLFFSTTVAMAVFTSRSWLESPTKFVEDSGWPSLRSLVFSVPILILVQLALGAAFRHKATGVIPHIVGAMVVTAVILIVSIFVLTQAAAHAALRQSALALLFIVFVQVFLGIAAYMARLAIANALETPLPMVLFTVAHVAVGALTLAASVVLAIHVSRSVRRGTMMNVRTHGATAAS